MELDDLKSAISPQHAAFILGKIALVVAFYFAFHLGQGLYKSSSLKLPELSTTSSLTSDKGQLSKPMKDFDVIASRNIFGEKAGKVAPSPKPKKSSLDMRLVGTNISSSGSPFAIVEDTKKKAQDVFEIDESMFGRGKLLEVRSNSITVSIGDRTEVLELADGPVSKTSGSSSQGGVPSDDQTEFSVPETELESALANLPRLLSQARAVPYFRNGKSIGMRLFAIRKGSLYEKLGLKNGDILKSVNDTSLSDPAQALKIFEQLKEEKSIGLKLERQGADKDLSYSID